MLKVLAFVIMTLFALSGAAAQGGMKQGPWVSNDLELEQLLNQSFFAQLYKAAGWGSSKTKVHLVHSAGTGLFMPSRGHLFITVGAIKDVKSPNELMGLIAHEMAHLEEGHLRAVRERALKHLRAGDQSFAIVATTKPYFDPSLWKDNMDLMRALLSERRAQEVRADQVATTILNKAGLSPAGFLQILERHAQQEYLATEFQDAYVRGHPISSFRVKQFKELTGASHAKDAIDPAALILRFGALQSRAARWGTRSDL